jgi:hypothetical protein
MAKSKLLWLIASGVLGGGGAAPVVDPEITVTGNGQSIADGDNTPSSGDHTDYGLSATLSTITRTFNIAVAAANLTGVSVALSGAGAGGFTITDQPDATINAGANSDFTIRYDALTPIAYTATVTIASNELPDFAFAIAGSSLFSPRALLTTPLIYLKLDETSGTTATDSSGNAYNGTYTGATLNQATAPQLTPAPRYDGVGDFTTFYSAGLGTAFSLAEGCALLWFKAFDASVWTNGTTFNLLHIMRDASNEVRINKSATNNQIDFIRIGGGTTKTISYSTSSTDWLALMLSWSEAGDFVKAYVAGVPTGATQSSIGTSAGSGLLNGFVILGANGTGGSNATNGYLAHFLAWNSAENAARVALGAG